MIAYIKGIVTLTSAQTIILVTQGIGYALHVARPENYTCGNEVEFFVHLHWNQEQGPTLFGFETDFERQLFILCTSVSGIGPKNALALLGHIGAEGVINALSTADTKTLSSVSGIGARKAETMILHLKDKITKLELPKTELVGAATLMRDVSDALSALGYGRPEITYALNEIKQLSDLKLLSCDQALRKALSVLAKRG